jgi:pimeloyl-ACP methyl ester carboxylesterase
MRSPSKYAEMPTPMPSYRFDQETYIHYEERGSGKHPVVMLHGFGASLETWFDITPYLPHYKLYLLDMKGFGLSSKPSHGGYGVRDHVPYVIAFIRYLGLTDFSLVGHSYGGLVATLLYLQAGSQNLAIRTAVLIDVPIVRVQFPLFVRVLQIPLLRRMIVSCLSPSRQASYVLHKLGYAPNFASSSRVHRYAKYFASPGTQNALIKTARALQTDRDIVLEFSGTFKNVLLLWGSDDSIFPLSRGREAAKLLRDCHFKIVPACGHIPHEEKPVATAAIINRFMKEMEVFSEVISGNIL